MPLRPPRELLAIPALPETPRGRAAEPPGSAAAVRPTVLYTPRVSPERALEAAAAEESSGWEVLPAPDAQRAAPAIVCTAPDIVRIDEACSLCVDWDPEADASIWSEVPEVAEDPCDLTHVSC
jgi:hypothetical protein